MIAWHLKDSTQIIYSQHHNRPYTIQADFQILLYVHSSIFWQICSSVSYILNRNTLVIWTQLKLSIRNAPLQNTLRMLGLITWDLDFSAYKKCLEIAMVIDFFLQSISTFSWRFVHFNCEPKHTRKLWALQWSSFHDNNLLLLLVLQKLVSSKEAGIQKYTEVPYFYLPMNSVPT